MSSNTSGSASVKKIINHIQENIKIYGEKGDMNCLRDLLNWEEILSKEPEDNIIYINKNGNGLIDTLSINKEYILSQINISNALPEPPEEIEVETEIDNTINEKEKLDEEEIAVEEETIQLIDKPEPDIEYENNNNETITEEQSSSINEIDQIAFKFQEQKNKEHDFLIELAKLEYSYNNKSKETIINHILQSHEATNEILQMLKSFSNEQRILHDKIDYIGRFVQAQLMMASSVANIAPEYESIGLHSISLNENSQN